MCAQRSFQAPQSDLGQARKASTNLPARTCPCPACRTWPAAAAPWPQPPPPARGSALASVKRSMRKPLMHSRTPASARAARTCSSCLGSCLGRNAFPLLSAIQHSVAAERALASGGACVQRQGRRRAVAEQARGRGARGGAARLHRGADLRPERVQDGFVHAQQPLPVGLSAQRAAAQRPRPARTRARTGPAGRPPQAGRRRAAAGRRGCCPTSGWAGRFQGLDLRSQIKTRHI